MDKEIRLKRLYFRSVHRGSKETDLILESYARENLTLFSDAAISEFEAFLEESDSDIWDWVSGKSMPEHNRYSELITALRKRYDLTE